MGREFNDLFDQWAESYDDTITGHDAEYMDVFDRYDAILQNVADKTCGFVIEFGVGTGNLTEKLLQSGKEVYGVEPSEGMRKKAQVKLPHITFVDGDFLQFPLPGKKADAIVSTYAFHHLRDEEKEKAIAGYRSILRDSGKIVFADTVFEDETAMLETIKAAEEKGFLRLAQDLKTEYYTTIPIMAHIFEANGFDIMFERQNHFVWLMEATKKER